MKPNDKAIEAAAKSLFGDYNDAEKKWVEEAFTAAYAAQFKSEDYAGLIARLRNKGFYRDDWLEPVGVVPIQVSKDMSDDEGVYPQFYNPDGPEAADAIEALLAKLNNKPKPSKDYAGLVERLKQRGEWTSDKIWESEPDCHEAADAIEALLAELKAQKEYNEVLTCKKLGEQARSAERYWEARWRDEAKENDKLKAERDALAAHLQAAAERLEKLAGDIRPPNSVTPQLFMLANSMKQNVKQSDRNARLAPVEDEALVEIACEAFKRVYNNRHFTKEAQQRASLAAAIAAIRPHIEAAERERCAKIAELHSYPMKTVAGTGYNNAAKEIAAAIRSGK